MFLNGLIVQSGVWRMLNILVSSDCLSKVQFMIEIAFQPVYSLVLLDKRAAGQVIQAEEVVNAYAKM